MSIPMPVGGIHTYQDAVHRMVAALDISDTTRCRWPWRDSPKGGKMHIRPIWMDRDRCDYSPVFVSGLLLGIAVGITIASVWWWEMVRL